MSTSSRTGWHQWILPVLSTLLLFWVLLFLFPFNSGISMLRSRLGPDLWWGWTTTENGMEDYTYCLFVPVIVAYLLFCQKGRLARSSIQGSNAAIAVILVGLLSYWIGARAGKQYLGSAGIQILLAGLILWFAGRGPFRILLFSLAFLTFAWPMRFLQTAVAFPLRMVVSRLANGTLNFMGIPSVQSGTALLSAPVPAHGLALGARFQIDVADPCSGLHSLLALLMLCALYGYLLLPRQWQRWIIFLSAIPFAVIGNVVRILLLAWGTLRFGTAFAVGTEDHPSSFHEACGFAVFGVVLVLEFLLSFLLVVLEKRRQKKSGSRVPAAATSAKSSSPTLDEKSGPQLKTVGTFAAPNIPSWRSGIIFGFALVMLVLDAVTPPAALPPVPGVVMNLPDTVVLPDPAYGKFFGFQAPVTAAEHRLLPKDTEFCRKNFDDFQGHQIFFSIVLSGVQQYTIHPPEVCLVAQGWDIVGKRDVSVPLSSGHTLVVRNLSIQRYSRTDDNQQHLIHGYYMYWYVAEGVTTPSQVYRNILSSWDRIAHNRDHRWAYITAMSLITDSLRPNGLDANQTEKMLAEFIRQVVPEVQKSEAMGPATVDE